MTDTNDDSGPQVAMTPIFEAVEYGTAKITLYQHPDDTARLQLAVRRQSTSTQSLAPAWIDLSPSQSRELSSTIRRALEGKLDD